MSLNLKAKARQTTAVERVSEGADAYLRAMRDGTLNVQSWVQAMVFEGRAFTADGGGIATTSIECAGAYDVDGADFVLDIPSTVAVIPVSLDIVVDTLTDDEDIEPIFYWANMANAVTTATAVVPKNMNPASNLTSACTCNVACNAANSTDVTGASKVGMLFRSYAELGAAPVAAQSEEGHTDIRWHWSILQDPAPLLIGAASVTGHVCKGTAAKAFISLKYIELPAASFS